VRGGGNIKSCKQMASVVCQRGSLKSLSIFSRRAKSVPAQSISVDDGYLHYGCRHIMGLILRIAGLFRRKFPPADNRNHDPDHRRDRTTDGPGRGVAHRATAEHSESLEGPNQTEQCEDQPERECSDESRSHIGILRAMWTTCACEIPRCEGGGRV